MGKRTQLGHTTKGQTLTYSKAALASCLVLFLSLGVGCRKKPAKYPMVGLLRFSRDMDRGDTITKKDIEIVQVDRQIYGSLGHVVTMRDLDWVVGGVLNQSVWKDEFVKYAHLTAVEGGGPTGVTPKPVVTPPKAKSATKPSTKPPKHLTLDLAKGVSMKLVLIPAGEFMMGSPKTEEGRRDSEGPQRKVTITKPFYMGVYEVTQEQYKADVGKNPTSFEGAKMVKTVIWDDAVGFCKSLSKKTGKTIRLPTEAEWEYACRAGTKTRFCFGDDEKQLGDYALHWYNSGHGINPVGQKKPNALGLYGMHGNVSEWCSDWWAPSYANAKAVDPQGPASGKNHVVRGGSWIYGPRHCRSAMRGTHDPDERSNVGVGFRVVVEVD